MLTVSRFEFDEVAGCSIVDDDATGTSWESLVSRGVVESINLVTGSDLVSVMSREESTSCDTRSLKSSWNKSSESAGMWRVMNR